MKIGLAYDLKPSASPGSRPSLDEEAEEYDPPETIDALASEIQRLGHRVVCLGGGLAFLENVPRAGVDFVFNIAEGRGVYRSREAQIPGILEMLGIPYSGSDPLTLALCLDKLSAKRVALSAGVRTPSFQAVLSLEELCAPGAKPLAFPLVIKPAFEGSSKGIHGTSRVESQDDLYQSVKALLTAYRQPALVEQFVPGREVTVGVVGNTPPRIVGVMEVVPLKGPDDDFMYTVEVKRNWRELVSYRCPPELPSEVLRAVEEAALTLYKELGCRDVARLDFRIDRANQVYFLEANPLPGLGSYSDLPIMADLAGWSYSRLIEGILDSALARYGLVGSRHARLASV